MSQDSAQKTQDAKLNSLFQFKTFISHFYF